MTPDEARALVVVGDRETFIEALRIAGVHATCWPAMLRWRRNLRAGGHDPPPPCFRGRGRASDGQEEGPHPRRS